MLKSAAYRAIGGENLSPWSKRVTATLPAAAALRRRADPARRPGRAGRCRWAAAGRDDAGSAGRDRLQCLVRHRARARPCPRAGGAERAPLPGRSTSGPKYVALYHLASPEVVAGPDWKRASESTPMPRAHPAADQRPLAPRLPRLPPLAVSPVSVSGGGCPRRARQAERFQPSQSQTACPITSSLSRPCSHGSSSVNIVTHCR